MSKKKYQISICIPARNEEWLARTVEDILQHKEAETEIIIGLDGKLADPVINDHPDVTIVYVPEAIGQRAITKMCARLSSAKYIIKCDAHCAFDQGFDRKMLEAFEKTGDNVVMVPVMNNLHVFNWRCYHNYCGWSKYQGPSPTVCPNCGKSNKLRKEIVWKSRHGVHSTSYCFDATPHFQYFEDWKHRPQYIKDKAEKGITESMSLQGSFFMCTREKYFSLDIDDESLGSWGHQGLTVACKFWLSGGRVLINHSTHYSHCFRTQGGDFSFPYPQSGRDVKKTKERVKDLFWNNKWDKQIHPVSFLIEKFWPVPGWTDQQLAQLKLTEKKQK